MNTKSTLLAAALAIASGVGVSTAHAQTTVAKGTEVIVFPDADELVMNNVGPDQAKVGGGHHPVRTILVRPRVSFVPELYKSIESL